METYRVLLVDDEEEIREGISRKIDWASLGFELVGEAENGAEALELCEQLRPDVVLTDIKMPFIDGLELCRRLRTQLPAARTVVFSGFDDFEYARQAISMNVSEYILEPINAPELRQVLQKLDGYKRQLLLCLLITLLWGLLLFTLFRWTAQREDEYTTGLARIQTATLFSSIVDTRDWNANNGGVWVREHPGCPANPWLPEEERTLRAEGGTTLVKVNPAYMTRQIAESFTSTLEMCIRDR